MLSWPAKRGTLTMVLRIMAINCGPVPVWTGLVLVERDIPNPVQSVLDCRMTPNPGRDLQRSGRHHRHRGDQVDHLQASPAAADDGATDL